MFSCYFEVTINEELMLVQYKFFVWFNKVLMQTKVKIRRLDLTGNMKDFLFEGTEKKLEIMFASQYPSLRGKGHAFWKRMCKRSKINIVSALSHSHCDCYLLSESSLFVWDHRLLMLTCGSSSLMESLLVLLKEVKQENIDILFYQRKNEYFPRRQKSSFVDDVSRLRKKMSGKAYCFGNPDEHHFYLFHSDNGLVSPPVKDRTVEILMYDLEDGVKHIFSESTSAQEIRQKLNLHNFFKNGSIDDYLFQPKGYSLNGIDREDLYYTVHATPQEPGFYVSFETNVRDKPVQSLVEEVIGVFKPLHFDIIVFSSEKESSIKIPASYILSSHFFKKIACGYDVSFYTFIKPIGFPRSPFIF